MKVEKKKQGAKERKILTAMIVNSLVLGQVATAWQKGMFKSPWANIVGQWCVDFHNRYRKAPKEAIEGLFENWSEDTNDEATVQIIEKFLHDLSGDYALQAKAVNAEYMIDFSGRYFKEQRLLELANSIKKHVKARQIDKAETKAESFGSVQMGGMSMIDVLQDKNAIREAFESKQEPLLTYPGALGAFVGDAFERDSFLALMGPEKRGKTWWLLEFAWEAMMQHRKVAFFEVGDLSKNQIMRRFMIRNSGRPMKEKEGVKVPKHINYNQDDKYATATHKLKTYKGSLDWDRAYADCRETLKSKLKTKDPLLKLGVCAHSSISISGISTILQNLAYRGWVADIVCIDYADILAPVHEREEKREQVNRTWSGMRRLSQELHCCVITATQADAASYTSDLIGKQNFSEDKRKLAHTTGIIGINQSEDEKQQGIQRLNWVVLRESEFVESQCVHVAGSLALARPAMLSTF